MTVPRPTGLYVVQFPDFIKVGKAQDVVARVRSHRNTGATLWSPLAVTFRDDPLLTTLEVVALRMLAMIPDNGRIGRSESFRGVSFEQAEDIVQRVAYSTRHDRNGRVTLANLPWTATRGLRYPCRRMTDVPTEVAELAKRFRIDVDELGQVVA